MSYKKQNFVDGQVLKAEHLNNIEEAISKLWKEIANVEKHTDEQVTSAINSYIESNGISAGLTENQIIALNEMFKVCAYTQSDVSTQYNAFKTAFGITDSGNEEPDTPTVTLTSISATYSGGEVLVGTDVDDLTGITVTGTYSDGSTKNIIDYTLSGTINEGTNTITVSYSGKTAEITVVGVAESSGEEIESNGWTNGQAYEIEWIEGYRLRNEDNGEPQAMSGRSITPFMPCQNASRLHIDGTVSSSVFWYDAEQNYIRYSSSNENLPIPTDAYYYRLCVTNENKAGFVATPYLDQLLTETTAWEEGTFYHLEFTVGQSINSTSGVVSTDANRTVSSAGYCYGASTIQIYPYGNNIRVAFYDVDGEYLGSFGTFDTSTGVATVPETAKTFKYHDYSNVSGYNAWVKLS